MKSVKDIHDKIAKHEAEIVKLRGEIVETERAVKAELREQFELMAARSGLTLSDVLGKPGKGVKKVAVQFRHKNGETWTGRGRRPRWAADMSKAQLEAFRVSA